MNQNVIDTYLQNRATDQITWMENKAKRNQQKYKLLKIMEIVAAAAIPFLAGMNDQNKSFPIITGLLGVILVVLNGMQQLHKYHENWITYRTTTEDLKREKILFENQIEPYTGPESFPKFVQNFESLLSKENKNWQTTTVKKQDEKP